MWLGLLTLTAVLGLRTCQAGRLPLTSGYGFALCFIWAVSVAYLVGERLGTKMLGVFVLPIVLALIVCGYLLFPAKQSIPLIPALQNKLWLHVHVSLAICAYGALALSCATGVMYFARRQRAARE